MKRFLVFALATLELFSGRAQGADPLWRQSQEFFSLPLDGAITIENSDGSIHIFSWYEPRVRVAALRRAYTEARLGQIRVETKAQPKSLAVRSVIPPVSGLFADRSGTVDYTVTVPETARLKLKLVNGEVTLEGLRGGSAEIELVNGRVAALNCFAQIQAHSVNGVLELFYDWWENLPAAFDYRIEHGRIGARLPAVAQFWVDAATANGRIGNGFGLQIPPSDGPGQLLQAKTGGAPSLSLILRTGGGNISIDRAP